MTSKQKSRFTVYSGGDIEIIKEPLSNKNENNDNYHTNPMYEKLLAFRNLQERQKKKFSVDDLFKLC